MQMMCNFIVGAFEPLDNVVSRWSDHIRYSVSCSLSLLKKRDKVKQCLSDPGWSLVCDSKDARGSLRHAERVCRRHTQKIVFLEWKIILCKEKGAEGGSWLHEAGRLITVVAKSFGWASSLDVEAASRHKCFCQGLRDSST